MSNPYTDWYLSEEKRILAEQAASEVDGMVERALRCPHCAHMAGVVYEDAKGHFTTKCMKCKQVFTVNFEHFRRPRFGTHPWISLDILLAYNDNALTA